MDAIPQDHIPHFGPSPDDDLVAALDGPAVNPVRLLQDDRVMHSCSSSCSKEGVRYIEPFRSWMVWNGARWINLSDTEMPTRAHHGVHVLMGQQHSRRRSANRYVATLWRRKRSNACGWC